jgi:hypothetical protein
MLHFAVVILASLLAAVISSNLVSIWLWVRARHMLRDLPRLAADSTLLGVSDRFRGPQRHLDMLGGTHSMSYGCATVLCLRYVICYRDSQEAQKESSEEL